jgi:hypothetical protein
VVTAVVRGIDWFGVHALVLGRSPMRLGAGQMIGWAGVLEESWAGNFSWKDLVVMLSNSVVIYAYQSWFLYQNNI